MLLCINCISTEVVTAAHHIIVFLLGTNENKPNDGGHFPHHHGFDFVGHILPFTIAWTCNPKKVTFPAISALQNL